MQKTRIKVRNIANYELLKLGTHTDLHGNVTSIAVVKDHKGAVSNVPLRHVTFSPSLDHSGVYVPTKHRVVCANNA
jgi:hypothetical protein